MKQKANLFNYLLYLLLITATLCPAAIGKIIYVDDDAPVSSVEDSNGGKNNGSNWENAYVYLQDALADANSAEKPVEIRVARGIYKPDQGAAQTLGDRAATFQLVNSVTLAGGYAGIGADDPNVRDIEQYVSILSGDLNADDDPNLTNIVDNSSHVVTASGTDATAILDGFTITGGNADGEESYYNGGGIYCIEGSPTMINCTINRNSTTGNGGGMYCWQSSNLILTNCRFTDNYALDEGGAVDFYKCDSQLIDCTFENNHAYIGGSCAINSVEISFINCAFIGNNALSEGGAISESRQAYGISNVCFENCLFAGNSSGWVGGAINFREKINGDIRNCTISNNRALYGESLCFKPFHTPTNNFKITSSILWGGDKQIYNGNNSKITITYSDIHGGWEGEGNMDEDPLFAEPGHWSDINDPNIVVEPDDPNVVWMDGDYHLKSQVGRFDPNSGNWVMDDVTSPCIDTGDSNSFIGDEPIPSGCRINMGAYGGTQQASMSPSDVNDISVIDQASNPIPTNEAIDVDSDIVLSWTSDPNALMYEVYLGTENPPPFIKRQFGKEFYPGTLELNTHYYWRIDEIDNLCNKMTGALWEFTTASQYSQATNPIPVNKAINVEIDVILSWSPGFNAIAHDVYLGTDFENVSNATAANTFDVLVSRRQGSDSYNPGYLEYDQTYYWRVDEVDSEGEIATGDIWSFKTIFVPAKGRACFTRETPVWVDGGLIAISKVSAEQGIRHLNVSGNVETVQEHEGTFNLYDIVFESGKTITVAENHYFMSEDGRWLSLHNLKPGTRLKTAEGSIEIKSITKRPKPCTGRVYNLKVKNSDRYMVGEDAVIVRDY
jgi:hypothetical protein